MVDNDMPGAWPVWTPGAPLAGFIKRNTIHCYKQNMKSGSCGFGEEDFLLLTKYESSGPCGFGEEDFLCFSHCKSMGANDPRDRAIFDPRGMIGRIYIEDH